MRNCIPTNIGQINFIVIAPRFIVIAMIFMLLSHCIQVIMQLQSSSQT